MAHGQSTTSEVNPNENRFFGRPGAMPDRTLDRYPVAPKNCRKTGCISIICSRPIASYS